MGSVCINRSSQNIENLQYPIINNQISKSPNKQPALEKPFIHSELHEDAQELTYLENILEDLDLDKKFTEEKITNEQNTAQYQQARINEIIYEVSQKLNMIVTQNKFQVEFQEKTSINLIINQGGSDTQTIRSILKINTSKSLKQVNRLKKGNNQKKVSFEARTLKQKNNKLFM